MRSEVSPDSLGERESRPCRLFPVRFLIEQVLSRFDILQRFLMPSDQFIDALLRRRHPQRTHQTTIIPIKLR